MKKTHGLSKKRHKSEKPHVQAANADALFSLALSQLQQGRMGESVRLFDQTIAASPGLAAAYINRGIALDKLGRFGDAVMSYDQAIALTPDYIEAYINRGLALDHMQQYREAVTSYDKAIAIHPGYASAWHNRGLALQHMEQYETALADYDRALSINPNYLDAYINSGGVLQKLKRHEDALARYDKALLLAPGYAEVHSNRGLVLNNLKRYADAVASCAMAISLRPNYSDAYIYLSLALLHLKQYDAALAGCEQVLALDPQRAEAYCNRGIVFEHMMKFDDALANYDKAIALDPRYADAYWNKGLLKLLQGDFETGLPLYEWRWELAEAVKRSFSRPQWSGKESLAGKTILLYAEQGLGDIIQFCRYVPMVEALGAKVLLVVRPVMAGLVSTLACSASVVTHLIGDETRFPAFDFHCPIMSLPLVFGTTLATIPAQIPYLYRDRQKQQAWQERLGVKTKPRIGLVWAGNTDLKRDQERSIPLNLLILLLDLDCEFHSLQKETRQGDETILASCPIISHKEALTDFTDTAALVSEMDVVISVDTSVAHLAGALGKPVWVLVHHRPEWRWLMNREDSPWYPTARIFGQPAPDDWAGVIENVKSALAETYRLSKKENPSLPLRPAAGPVATVPKDIMLKAIGLHQSGKLEEAQALYQELLTSYPNDALLFNLLGMNYADQERYDEALTALDRAIILNPGYDEVHFNRGALLKKMGRYQEAAESYDKAIAVNPEHNNAHWNKAIMMLLLGNYEEGWKLYEWRKKKNDIQITHIPDKPLWTGREPLQGKTILLHAEQGFGDAIQFCRYVPMVEALGAKIILVTFSPLLELMSSLGKYPIMAEGANALVFDFHCPLMSLPLAFGTTLQTIPAKIPYLFADTEKCKWWQGHLGEKTKPRIGFVWSGSAKHTNDYNRSIPLPMLASLSECDAEFHSVQKEVRPADLEYLQNNKKVHLHGEQLKDFSQTAALLSHMDLVISVDTSVVHLAGALGKPVWILLPYVHDFRWLLNRKNSPWYPSARIFRQPAPGDWASVIEQVKAALETFISDESRKAAS